MTSLRETVALAEGANQRPVTRSPDDKRLGRDRRVSERRVSERRHGIDRYMSRETRLRFAAQAAGFGTYDMDCATGDSVWSPELAAMVGLPEKKTPLSTEQAESLIHPDDRPRFFQKLHDSLDPKGTGEFEDEHRLVRADGTICWVKIKGRTFFIGEGGDRRALAATGVVMDITASRAAQQELLESREELSELLDSAIDGIITIEPDQRIVRFNPAASRMFRCPTDEVLGTNLERFIPERHRAKHREGVRQVVEGSVPAHVLGKKGDFFALRMDGEEFPFEASIARVMVDRNCQMTVFMRDITDRVEAEKALRQSKEFMELAVRGANLGVWVWNMKTGEVSWSARCYELLGIPAGEPVNFERILKTVRPSDMERLQAALKSSMEEGMEFHMERQAVWPDGSLHWVESIGRYLLDDDGRPLGMRGVIMDIEERKHLEALLVDRNKELEDRIEERTAQLKQANEALEQSNLELQQFASVAAHDLQSPLRSIIGLGQLLQKEYGGRFDSRADEWLSSMIRSTKRMHDAIQDILAYSRVDSRGSAFGPVDFNEVFDAVVGTLEAPILDTGAVITRAELPVVKGDQSQLAQLLQNLLDNAVKYHSGDTPKVHVSAKKTGKEWVFSVRDNGIGIAQKHLDSIFEIFRRLHGHEKYPGTGIGLAICRRVVLRHGGRIWVESEPGVGSTFFFTLPTE